MENTLSMDVPSGIYEHFKGKRYEVIGVARHSETREEMVVYRALYTSEYGTNALWVRPKAMFVAMVATEHGMVPRFKKVDE